jgi:hypothetical protein
MSHCYNSGAQIFCGEIRLLARCPAAAHRPLRLGHGARCQ